MRRLNLSANFIFLVILLCIDLAHSSISLTDGRVFIESQGGTPTNVITEGEIFLPSKLRVANVGEDIFFQVESNVTLPGKVNRVTVESDDQFTWNGNLTDRYDASWYLSYKDGCITAIIETGDGRTQYEINADDFTLGVYVVRKVDALLFYPEDEVEIYKNKSIPLPKDSLLAGSLPDGGDVNKILDVAFLYTNEALEKRAKNSVSQMESQIDLGVLQSNTALESSQIDFRIRRIYTGKVNGNIRQEEIYQKKNANVYRSLMQNLFDRNDKIFDIEVAELEALGADVITLIVADESVCGYAYINYGNALPLTGNIVNFGCTKSIIHEIAHNFGSDHNFANAAGDSDKDYNYGHCWDTSIDMNQDKACRRSLMAYGECETELGRKNCMRELVFSNPNVTNGMLAQPTGVSASGDDRGADNARYLNEKKVAITNINPSMQQGGIVQSVHPPKVIGCNHVKITGWGLSVPGDDVTFVSLNGIEVTTIVEQTPNEVQVVAGRPEAGAFGLGDLVIRTATGYTTNYTNYFTYQSTEQTVLQDFEGTIGSPWSMVVCRDCLSLNSEDPNSIQFKDYAPKGVSLRNNDGGPDTGQGGGRFLKVKQADARFKREDEVQSAYLLAEFNNDEELGCIDEINQISFYYHLFSKKANQKDCHGSVTGQVRYNGSTAWETLPFLQATEIQQALTDDWIKLEHNFESNSSKIITGLKIIVTPYNVDNAAKYSCALKNAIGLDSVSFRKTITCGESLCDDSPSRPPVEGTESYDTGAVAVTNTDSGSNENTASYCFNVTQEMAEVTVQSYHDECYDTRVNIGGDSFIRLRKDDETGEQIAENDDVNYPSCRDSRIVATIPSGRYCLMMGCLGDMACEYDGKVIIAGAMSTAAPTVNPPLTVLDTVTAINELSNTNSASNENTVAFCFDVTNATAVITATSFHDECYDTRFGLGDAYMRLKRSSDSGVQVAESDDFNYPDCTDSKIEATVLSGSYCLMMGCYADTECSYSARVIVQESLELQAGVTGLIDVGDTNSGSNANAASYSFTVSRRSTVTVQSYHEECYDTSNGDSYIRLRKNTENGPQIYENDDVDYPACSDSRINAVLEAGTYWLIMGCYAETDCSYNGRVIIEPKPIGGDDPIDGDDVTTVMTDTFDLSFTNSARNDNTQDYCFALNRSSFVDAQTFLDVCHDTRPADGDVKGDPYLRLRQNGTEGAEIAANDDVDATTCSDAKLSSAGELKPGTYCLMMGCYGCGSCAYSSKITITPSEMTNAALSAADKAAMKGQQDREGKWFAFFIAGVVLVGLLLVGRLSWLYLIPHTKAIPSVTDEVYPSTETTDVFIGHTENTDIEPCTP